MIIPAVGELWMDINGCISIVFEETANGYHLFELDTGEVWWHQTIGSWQDGYSDSGAFYCKRL